MMYKNIAMTENNEQPGIIMYTGIFFNNCSILPIFLNIVIDIKQKLYKTAKIVRNDKSVKLPIQLKQLDDFLQMSKGLKQQTWLP